MSRRLSILLLALVAWTRPVFTADTNSPVLPPIPPSPIEDFRRWLQMPPADREKELAVYPAEKREVLRRKLQAYETMPVELRDARLRALELRWYLPPLMSASTAHRANYLDVIPPRLHASINARLKHWDKLNEATRREILADKDKRELVTRYLVYPQRHSAPPMPVVMPPHPRELDEHFKRWENKSPAAHAKMSSHLSTFFQMPREEQRDALNTLSETERQEMQKTLEAFTQLSPRDRRACVDSFQRFATMSRHERASFLRNATRWQQLTPEERATWRNLVSQLPPMPPEPLPTPPRPQALRPGGNAVASTNPSPQSPN